jgi:hypothetical protein
MKRLLNKKELWQSIFSLIAAGVFILVAVGSDIHLSTTEHLGNGVYKETLLDGSQEINGKRDGSGRWHGNITNKYINIDKTFYTEECNWDHGARNGTSTTTYPDGHKIQQNYIRGYTVDPGKAAHSETTDAAAFQILEKKYPWYLISLNVYGFDGKYVQAYLDAVETKLNALSFKVAEFDINYENVTDSLGKTPYDSIIQSNSYLIIFLGMTEMKNSEFRLAVIDHYQPVGKSTYSIISTTYPGYLKSMNDSGITNQNFEKFCLQFDDSLTRYGPLNPADPFFTDSVDSRLYRALSSIAETEKSASIPTMLMLKSAAMINKGNDFRNICCKVFSLLNPLSFQSGTKTVTSAIEEEMGLYFMDGDILRRAVKEAYLLKKGGIRLPIVATEFSGNSSASSADLKVYVIEDGGAAVTSRGIAWAPFNNPTVKDKTATKGIGTATFTITATGLTVGTTYYVRAFATNSAGTAYGNSIKFVASSSVGLYDKKTFVRELTIYPNPVSVSATLRFWVESTESMTITITDLKGQVVLCRDFGSLPEGETQIKLNLLGLQNGLYTCQITNSRTKVTQKLVIAH